MNTTTHPARCLSTSEEVLAARRRRVNGLLNDVGVLAIVGHDWVRPVQSGFVFTPLEGRTAEQWLRWLDTLAEVTPSPRRHAAGAAQLELPFAPASLRTLGVAQ